MRIQNWTIFPLAFPAGREVVAQMQHLLRISQYHWPLDSPTAVQEVNKGYYLQYRDMALVRGIEGGAMESRKTNAGARLLWSSGCICDPTKCM